MASNSSYETSWADQWDPEPMYNYDSNTKTGGSSKYSSKVGDKFDKSKAVAITGMKKMKTGGSAAITGMRKVKTGATTGFHWIKEKYQKRTQKH
ncbi:uncharacterized protein LOC111396533 [Olea europaea var. sylvestris]|uniref:uncharacterized protein LOC111396533 n=1 Tax=Olea europaea var. sylvestris TaxID=158386 RepID=UPI000C1CF1D1|nr:uncharacterized protein LOC111396533 [Olea europaea var. sylvestris]